MGASNPSKPAYSPGLHFHIRWSPSGLLDWQAFDTQAEAEAAAAQLSRPSETYTIEASLANCGRCDQLVKEKLSPMRFNQRRS